MTSLWRDLARHYLQVAAFCCVIAVLTTAIWPSRGYLGQLGYALCVGTVSWAVIDLGRLLLTEPGHRGWPRGWRGLVLTAVGIVCGFYFGSMLGDYLLGAGDGDRHHDATVSWVITAVAGATISYFFHVRGRQSEMTARISASERDAAEAKLKLLETQLEPHMLFNTLANLRVLIATDPPRAIDMLDRLNSYLRVTLAGSRALAHPLAAEFARLADYLALMAVRMGERLRFTLDLPEDLRAVPVPPLLLQPLVENAIRHGLEPQVEGGEIHVRARRQGARLVIEVEDSGAGLDTAAPPGPTQPPNDEGGFGLAQVRERLAAAHGEQRASLSLAARAGGGTLARIELPFPADAAGRAPD